MIVAPPTEPFLDPDNPREIALVPLRWSHSNALQGLSYDAVVFAQTAASPQS